jgi:hypothetical protein
LPLQKRRSGCARGSGSQREGRVRISARTAATSVVGAAACIMNHLSTTSASLELVVEALQRGRASAPLWHHQATSAADAVGHVAGFVELRCASLSASSSGARIR